MDHTVVLMKLVEWITNQSTQNVKDVDVYLKIQKKIGELLKEAQ